MKKEIQTLGLILKIYPLGENSQRVNILCNEGLLTFTSYGTQNSLKRTRLYPLMHAVFHLHAKRHNWTLLEVHSIQNFDNIAKELPKFYTACLLQEIALHSYAGQELYLLLRDSCQLLNTINSQVCIYVVIQFLWRWLLINGQQPSLNECSSCNQSLNESFFYIHLQENFLCSSCSKSFKESQLLSFDQGIKSYLSSTRNMPLTQAIQRRLTHSSLVKLVNYLYQKVENILKWKIKSWNEGKDFIFPNLLS